ncbi:MAG: hypothetical protein E4H16_03180 [Candidatus Atribacteria bacterium]|nr:MAG: hypothetical protein E4H16_03180 [Candidatus Atribacteria bacterium]
MPRYAVIACPKCREHAQIIEYDTARTTKCQKCSAVLKIRKLRIFYTSDSLDEAISARTQLQAQMHDKTREPGNISANNVHVFSNGTGEQISIPNTGLADKRKRNRPKRDARKIVIDLLLSSGGGMDIKTLKAQAMEQDVAADKLEMVLDNLLQTGEIYSPEIGYIRIV